MVDIDKSGMTPLEEIDEVSEGRGEQYRSLAKVACRVLSRYSWCKEITQVYWDRGFFYVSVFYIELVAEGLPDSAFWVIVGDVPPSFIDLETAVNGAQALAAYADLCLQWCEAIEGGKQVQHNMPMLDPVTWEPLEMTAENASFIRSKMEFIEKNLLSDWRRELGYDD